MISGSMSFKGHGEMAIITSISNAHLYIEILNYLFNLLTEKLFTDAEVIIQENNVSFHRENKI